MRIGIYNRRLSTLGGGERHSLAIAVHLARDHSVDYISHSPVVPHEIADRVDMDLDRIGFHAIPLRPPAELETLASQYDLFINASNADFVPPCAKRNAMLVFFPARPPEGVGQSVRRALIRQIDRFAMQPSFVAGVYDPIDVSGSLAYRLGQSAEIALPAASPMRPYRVRLALAAAHPSVKGAELQLDGELAGQVSFPTQGQFVPVTLSISAGQTPVLTIHATGESTGDTVWLHMQAPQIASLGAKLYRRVFVQLWPELGVRHQSALPRNLRDIASEYDLIWANSRYTQRWIRAYWGLPSTVLYPPVPVERYLPHHKRRQILSVGRFFAGNHNKKHIVMVDAFKRLLADGLSGWELHLVGGVTPGPGHMEYLQKVRAAAQGHPVQIHTDLSSQEVIGLYGSSAIYWHAAGFAEDPTRQPGKLEHFGISVVEAMAAGCVPVVVGQGGLAELVRHQHDGYLWYTTRDLRTYTSRLAQNPSLRSRMAQAAMVSSRRFDTARFGAELDTSLAPLMSR